MEIGIEWHERVISRRAAHFFDAIMSFDTDSLPETAGIYVFARKFGKNIEPIYIGKAENLRSRVGQQLNNLKLMKAVRERGNGSRVLLIGEVSKGRGKQLRRVLPIVERAHIRAAQSAGYRIVNVQGTRSKTHSIVILGRRPHRFPFERTMLDDA